MITAERLSFGYKRERPIVRDWSASIQAGEAVSITGPSGSGKSTVLYLLGTLVRPWSGTLRIGAVSVEGLGDRGRSDVRSTTIGFVFQDAILDQRRSILDNIIEGAVYGGHDRGAASKRALALLDQVGVDVEPTRRATDLSGGQAQRVALCRALLSDPAIILADEPTGNLDRVSASGVEAVLFDRARAGATLVIVTHNEGLAARCDRTLPL